MTSNLIQKLTKRVGVDDDKTMNLNILKEEELVRQWGLQACIALSGKKPSVLLSFEFYLEFASFRV